MRSSPRPEIAWLSFPLAGYRRAEFGCSSEELAREAEQLDLVLETVEARPGRRARYGIADRGSSRRRGFGGIRSQLYAFVRSICWRARKTILSPA